VSRVAQRSLAVGLLVAAVVWIFVNKPVEGPVLLLLSPTHGVTVADLGSVAAVLVAGFLLIRSWL
jgi:hypothetical protein